MSNVKHFVFKGQEKECWNCKFVAWKAEETHYACLNEKSKFHNLEVQYGDGCDQFEKSPILDDMVVIPKETPVCQVIELFE